MEEAAVDEMRSGNGGVLLAVGGGVGEESDGCGVLAAGDHSNRATGGESGCDVVMAVVTKKGSGQYINKFDSIRRTLVASAIIIGCLVMFVSYFVSVRLLLVHLCLCIAPPPTPNLSKMELLVRMVYKLYYW